MAEIEVSIKTIIFNLFCICKHFVAGFFGKGLVLLVCFYFYTVKVAHNWSTKHIYSMDGKVKLRIANDSPKITQLHKDKV